MLRGALHRFYRALEQRLVPGLQSSQHHYEKTLEDRVTRGVHWLDIGCGRRMLPEWRLTAERELCARAGFLVGIDLDLPSLRDNTTVTAKCYCGVPDLPFHDSSFDLVTANMVVEHLNDPARAFAAVARVLRPGGKFIFHTPNAAAYPTTIAKLVPEVAKQGLARLLDGRRASDVFPTHYLANTRVDIARVAELAGLAVEEMQLVSSSAVFAVVPPLALVELIWLRRVQQAHRAEERSNLVVTLRRQ